VWCLAGQSITLQGMTFLHCEVGEEEGQLEEIIVEGFLIAVRCALQVAVIVSWSGSLTPQIPNRH
jgi:hypothetical protein